MTDHSVQSAAWSQSSPTMKIKKGASLSEFAAVVTGATQFCSNQAVVVPLSRCCANELSEVDLFPNSVDTLTRENEKKTVVKMNNSASLIGKCRFRTNVTFLLRLRIPVASFIKDVSYISYITLSENTGAGIH